MITDSIWIVGTTRSGKTARLIEQLDRWISDPAFQASPATTALVMAANGDNRLELVDRLDATIKGRQPFHSTTPLGFFQTEVTLFFPLIAQKLDLRVQFPLRLRPETEQELATQLWHPELETGELAQAGVSDYFMVRRSLDLLQLAAFAGIPAEDIPAMLADGFAGQPGSPALWECIGRVILRWREWCLQRGLLTYGIITELYWRYLLTDPIYQHHLSQRYWAVLADDVDEYPAIAQSLFSLLLDHPIRGGFTYNPHGSVRLGLGADPTALLRLSDRCHLESLAPLMATLGSQWGETVLEWISEPMLLPELPSAMQVIQTTSRAQLLRQTAETIITAVHEGLVQPHEVAVIGAGVDAIARYTLREILTNRGISVESLNDQQPLASAPMIRALLTLLALVYPGCGQFLERDAIAELLVMFSQPAAIAHTSAGLTARIDPVRAGLLTDHCFVPDRDRPRLLAATQFPRWDRLGHQATYLYDEIVQWIETQQQQQQQRLIPSPVSLLDRAIQRFLFGGSHLPYDQLAALRELMETAQHYWEVDSRLKPSSLRRSLVGTSSPELPTTTVAQFIQLLRGGTITADPYPVRPLGGRQAVTLATIFQYRSHRRAHRWQFWLDAGSSLWLTGGGALFGAPLMLHEWSGRSWTATDTLGADQQRLQRQVADLLQRVSDRVYLCHSDLTTNGQEQVGPLLGLVNAAISD